MTEQTIPESTLANAHTPIVGDSKSWVYGCGKQPDGLCPTSKQCVAAAKCLKPTEDTQ